MIIVKPFDTSQRDREPTRLSYYCLRFAGSTNVFQTDNQFTNWATRLSAGELFDRYTALVRPSSRQRSTRYMLQFIRDPVVPLSIRYKTRIHGIPAGFNPSVVDHTTLQVWPIKALSSKRHRQSIILLNSYECSTTSQVI